MGIFKKRNEKNLIRKSDLDRKELSISERERKLKEQARQVSYEKDQTARLSESLSFRSKSLDAEISRQVNSRVSSIAKAVSDRNYFYNSPVFKEIRNIPIEENSRLQNAASQLPHIISVNLASKIHGSNQAIYETSLYSCTCPNFRHTGLPCKHMYRLAFEVGILFTIDDASYRDALSKMQAEKLNLDRDLTQLEHNRKKLESLKSDFKTLVSDTRNSSYLLAEKVADFEYLNDINIAHALATRHPPAPRAADEVSAIAKKKRELQFQNKIYQYQLLQYESLFPDLLDYKDTSIVNDSFVFPSDDNEERTRFLLASYTDEEYQLLSSAEKSNIALERWKTRRRTDWDAGIDYERYIAYLYEKDGYKVEAFGAVHGLEDMGRDIIAKKGKTHIIIQCKRWSTAKLIHEKHIFQLYGTTVLYSMEHPGAHVSGLFVTTTSLSDKAQHCADYLHIEVWQHKPLSEYPLIKCNISRTGKKIYHLPMDQQYDKVQINFKAGEFYASTADEAEAAGFVRARMWLPLNQM